MRGLAPTATTWHLHFGSLIHRSPLRGSLHHEQAAYYTLSIFPDRKKCNRLFQITLRLDIVRLGWKKTVLCPSNYATLSICFSSLGLSFLVYKMRGWENGF